MINEKILVHYERDLVYKNDPKNAVGATKSTTLRTVTTHNDTVTKYVKKFGNAYTIEDITDGVITTPRSDGGGVNKWWYEFYDFDTHTLLATVKDENGVSTFVDGAALASAAIGVYVKVVLKSGTATINNGDRVRVDTDIDVGGRNIRFSAETFTSGEMLFYFAYSSSSYYMDSITDQSAKYGGYRGAGVGTLRQPYFNIQDAIDAVAAAGAPFTNVTVLDSESYDEQPDADFAGIKVQAALGQTPTITSGVGARVTREVEHDGNNADTAYVSKTGDDANDGTYKEPYLTITFAEANIGARTSINIMDDNFYNESIDITTGLIVESIYGKVPTIHRTSVVDYIFRINHTDVVIAGFNIDGNTMVAEGIRFHVNYSGNTKNNDIYNCIIGIGNNATFSGNILFNHVYNCVTGGIVVGGVNTGLIEFNIIHDVISTGAVPTGSGILMNAVGVGTQIARNNICYDCTIGILLGVSGATATTIENNTIYDCNYGLYVFDV
ncbi:MAG: hypothetical protein V3U02_01505, partial [Calditrichia bacterium]